MSLVYLLLLSLLGCAPSPATAPEAGEDTAAMHLHVDVPEPLWGVDDVGAALYRIMGLGAPNPADITQTFLALMSEGDLSCPGHDEWMETPPDGCETNGGYRYQGVASYEAGGVLELADGTTVDANYGHSGDYEIFRPDGSRFAGGGGLAYDTKDEEGSRTNIVEVHGTFLDEAHEGWLGLGFSGVFVAFARSDSDGGWAYEVTGGMALGADVFSFDEVRWDSADACAGKAQGSISLRDPRGYWTEWRLGDDCDLCGEVVFYEDQELGELCLDTQPWGQSFYFLNVPR